MTNSCFLLPNSYLLLGYYGFGNLGDELLLEACIKILNSKGISNENIIALSNNPEETQKNFKIKSVNRWKFFEVVKAMQKSENLILGGGGLFQDSTSVKSCVYYWGIVRLAKFFGLKIFALGQSIGLLRSGLAKFLTRDALKLCEEIQVRDENSFKTAKSFGCKNLILGEDLVLQLKIKNENSKLKNENKTLLVNLRPYKDFERFLKITADIIKNFNGKKIGAAFSPEDEKVLSENQKILALDEIILLKNFNDAEKLFSSASSAVGMRLHFGVLAKIFEVPATLLAYDIKVKEFAARYNIQFRL